MNNTGKNLPPPHWSPTGNSGTWYWDENEKFSCWMWVDDEQLSPPPTKKVMEKDWFKKLFNFFLTKR